MKCLRRAYSDTFQSRYRQLISAGAIGLLGWLYLYFAHGEDFAVAELPFMYGALFGTAALVAALFVWNLACAPYRIERDRRISAEARTADLEKILPKHVGRTLNSDQKAQVTDAIRKSGVSPESINVVYYNVSEECANFAEKIGDAIQAVPIKCAVHQGSMFPHNPKDRGVKIYRGDTASLRKLAEHIQTGLEKAGVISEVRETSDKTETIHLYVARSDDA